MGNHLYASSSEQELPPSLKALADIANKLKPSEKPERDTRTSFGVLLKGCVPDELKKEILRPFIVSLSDKSKAAPDTEKCKKELGELSTWITMHWEDHLKRDNEDMRNLLEKAFYHKLCELAERYINALPEAERTEVLNGLSRLSMFRINRLKPES